MPNHQKRNHSAARDAVLNFITHSKSATPLERLFYLQYSEMFTDEELQELEQSFRQQEQLEGYAVKPIE